MITLNPSIRFDKELGSGFDICEIDRQCNDIFVQKGIEYLPCCPTIEEYNYSFTLLEVICDQKKQTIIYTSTIITEKKTLPSTPSPHSEIRQDMDEFRAQYGLHYVQSIEIGVRVKMIISLESNEQSVLRQVQEYCNGDFDQFITSIGPLIADSSLKAWFNGSIDGHPDNEAFKKLIPAKAKEFIRLLRTPGLSKQYKIPIRISVLPMPSKLHPLLAQLDFDIYQTKVNQIHANISKIEEMTTVLSKSKKTIQHILEDDNLSAYVETLYTKVSQFIRRLRVLHEDTVKLLKDKVDNILK
ncbi:hypothetical protein DFA_01784 [Cavenderia fasciculata]|uniref:Uncharacterized protein n=1 Tax=Cavenderia fasciculata TaxID=261658 RepID=F4PUN4_CACFS|nr:uncharacterized protein DFA_01784 [Cavenderia fasciculata]EGG21898.1 hypothetical protein DFA_01784 [Cavenderia fasciculata]|eukprot:XP_004359749.1 hypothetical protein DFA_01784 [Cavenderia fasciculata]